MTVADDAAAGVMTTYTLFPLTEIAPGIARRVEVVAGQVTLRPGDDEENQP